MLNVLYRTKCTVIGPMQFHDGTVIRDYFKNNLRDRNITVFDHYNNPFLDECVKDDKSTGDTVKELMAAGNYKEVEKYRKIRAYDLALIDKSDFIITNFIPNITMCGTWEEFFNANRQKKPIFFINEYDMKLTPHWVFWTIPLEYIYSSKEAVLETIYKIDDGLQEIDSDRWRLLKRDFR